MLKAELETLVKELTARVAHLETEVWDTNASLRRTEDALVNALYEISAHDEMNLFKRFKFLFTG